MSRSTASWFFSSGRARAPSIAGLLALATIALCAACAGEPSRSNATSASNTRPAEISTPQVASAQAADAPRDAVERLPTVLIISPWGRSGTALRLSDQLFLTARHVLPRRGDWIELGRDGKRFRFERIAQGEEEGVVGDWALIRVLDAPASLGKLTEAPVLNSSFVRPDREVFLSGYWQGPGRWTRMSRMRNVPLTTVSGPAIEMSDSASFPRRHLAFVEVASRSDTSAASISASKEQAGHSGQVVDLADVYSGMSGGPAAIWNAREGRAEIIGVYVGGGEYERVFEGRNGRAQIVRRIPSQVVELVRAESEAGAAAPR